MAETNTCVKRVKLNDIVIGRANSWDEAARVLTDYIYKQLHTLDCFIGKWNNFGQLRVMCFDHYLEERGHDPKQWNLTDENTFEFDEYYVINI